MDDDLTETIQIVISLFNLQNMLGRISKSTRLGPHFQLSNFV
jgi:hypothetical protein